MYFSDRRESICSKHAGDTFWIEHGSQVETDIFHQYCVSSENKPSPPFGNKIQDSDSFGRHTHTYFGEYYVQHAWKVESNA